MPGGGSVAPVVLPLSSSSNARAHGLPLAAPAFSASAAGLNSQYPLAALLRRASRGTAPCRAGQTLPAFATSYAMHASPALPQR
jgi:hypothetical protein